MTVTYKFVSETQVIPEPKILTADNGGKFFGFDQAPDEKKLEFGYKPLAIDVQPDARDGYHYEPRYADGDTAITQSWLEVQNPPVIVQPKIYSKNKIREQLIATPTPQGVTTSASDAFNGLLQQAGFLNIWLDAAYLKSDNPAVLALRASPDLAQLLGVYGLNLDTLLLNAEDETWRVVDNGSMF